VVRVCYSPDQRWLASCDYDNPSKTGAVRVWDAARLTPALTLEGEEAIYGDAAFSPDSRFLAAAGNGGIALWELPAGKLRRIFTGHDGPVLGVAFSPDGQLLASAGLDTTLRLWTVAQAHEERVLRGHTNRVSRVAFSPGGDRLASASADGTARVWDLTTDREFGRLLMQRRITEPEAIAYADGGRQIIAVQRGGRYLRLETGTYTLLRLGRVGLFGKWMTPAEPACLDAGGRYLAGIAAGDQRVAQSWDLVTGQERAALRGHQLPIGFVTISGDGQRVATCAFGALPSAPGYRAEIRVWDAADGRTLFQHAEDGLYARRVALDPRGRLLALAGATVTMAADGRRAKLAPFVKVYDVSTGREVRAYRDLDDFFGALAFRADGTRLAAAGSRRGVVRVWDMARDGRAVVAQQGPEGAMDAAFSPDGQRLAIASRTMIKILDAGTGEEVFVLRGYTQRHPNDNGFNARVHFSPDGKRVLAICHDQSWALAEWSIENEADLAARSRAAGRRAVLDHLHRADQFSREPKGLAFRHHYGQIRDVPLANAHELIQRGQMHGMAGDWDRADVDFAEAARCGRADAHVLAECANAYAARARWDRAGGLFAEALALDPDHFDARCGAIDVCLSRGKRAAAAVHCRELLRRIGNTDDPHIADEVVRRLLVVAGTAPAPGQVTRLAERALARDCSDAYRGLIRGMAAFRAGQFKEALARLKGAAWGEADEMWVKGAHALNLFFTALAEHHLHHPDAARARLAEGVRVLDSWPRGQAGALGGHWAWWTLAQAVRAEAKTLLEQSAKKGSP
jgi:WD40 repeat protein